MLKKFCLTQNSFNYTNDAEYPDLSAAYVDKKEIILDKKKDYNDFFPSGIVFTPLIPKFIGYEPRQEAKVITDFPGWIENQPKGVCFPISNKFRNIIDKFHLPPFKFFEAEVVLENEILSFSVIQLTSNYYESLIDFNESTFCNTDFFSKEKLSDDHEKITDFREIRPLYKKKGWKYAGFNRAVMKPDFERLDLISTIDYGLIISERLKEAIESAGITGVKIEECPIQFEINYDLEITEKTVSKTAVTTAKINVTTPDISPEKVTRVVFSKGIRFKTQAAVDKFQTDYPDCIEIIGNVFIQSTEIQNLNGLSKIERINGCFMIITAPNLESLTGLSNLKVIGGELKIYGTKKLTSLKGLENLEAIKSNGLYFSSPIEQGLEIDGNEALVDISALSKLKKLVYVLNIANNPLLISLKGLENLQSVGNYFMLQGNNKLVDISALKNLKNIYGEIVIVRNRSLDNLRGLENLESAFKVEISDNGNLPTIKNLEGLKSHLR